MATRIGCRIADVLVVVMVTDTIFACFVEEGDYLSSGDQIFEVIAITDQNDNLTFFLKDEEGLTGNTLYAPFDHVSVVTSFSEEIEWEDVDIDA